LHKKRVAVINVYLRTQFLTASPPARRMVRAGSRASA
jgi:hypothetical protein